MADAKMCDRCGSFYKNNKEPRFALLKIDNSSNHVGKWYDICPDCENELKKWLERSKNENG